jgi:putative intracellular protease/amidase
LLNSYKQNSTGIVGAICHGPVALTHTNWVRGTKLCAFSTDGDRKKEQQWGGELFVYPEQLLKAAGAIWSEAQMYNVNVVVDGRLITGQNPQSAEKFGKDFVSLVQYPRKCD